MKNRKWKLLLLVMAATAVFGTAGTMAVFSSEVSVRNEIHMGDVDIALREYALIDGREVEYQGDGILQPGDIVSKIPRITNEAEPCWIRVRVRYVNDQEALEGFSDGSLKGFSSKWVKRGEYYYYTEILKTGESVDLFHQLEVPSEWDASHNGQQLAVDIQAEAIQAVHMTPDFEALSPWGGQEVELCVHEENNRPVENREVLLHKIEFNGSAHRLLAISEDFFSNFGAAMPGDVLTDEAELLNTTDSEVELYFHTEGLSLDEQEEALLDQLRLDLYLEDQLLYSGSLRAGSLDQEQLLVRLKAGEGGRLFFTITVPEELKNDAALRKTSVKWVFRAAETPVITPVPTETPAEELTPTAAPKEKKEEKNEEEQATESDSVQTGDESALWFYRMLLVMAGMLVLLSVVSLKKGGKKS
jgi:predicted ribosomally synthesized peptide with SipW-like signal peptide